MPNYRELHRQYLDTYLSSITFDSQALSVVAYSTTKSNVYPYIFIMSLEAQGNFDNQSMLSNSSYRRVYTYAISIVHQTNENEAEQLIIEKSIDEIENLILDKLQTQNVRDCVGNSQKWDDLIVKQITSPYSGDRINLEENNIIKTIQVDIYQPHQYL